MDLTKMIAELQAERDRLDQAILALERLSAGKERKRGRPPKWLKNHLDGLRRSALEEPTNGQSSLGKQVKSA
jgi:hypothetical protein